MNPILTILGKVVTNVYFYVGLLIIALLLSMNTCKHNRAEADLANQNTTALLAKVDLYADEIGTNSATIERLSLSVRDFKDYKTETTRQLDSLGIKVNRLLISVSNSEFRVKYYISTTIRDSIRQIAGKVDTIRCLDYKNKWLTLKGCDDGISFSGYIQDLVPIMQVIQRVPHRFLFIRWGTKAVTQTIQSTNPYAKVTYDQYIEFTK